MQEIAELGYGEVHNSGVEQWLVLVPGGVMPCYNRSSAQATVNAINSGELTLADLHDWIIQCD